MLNLGRYISLCPKLTKEKDWKGTSQNWGSVNRRVSGIKCRHGQHLLLQVSTVPEKRGCVLPCSLHSAFSWKTERHLAPAFKNDNETIQSILTLFSVHSVYYNRSRPVLRPLTSVQIFLYALLPAGFMKLQSMKWAVLILMLCWPYISA